MRSFYFIKFFYIYTLIMMKAVPEAEQARTIHTGELLLPPCSALIKEYGAYAR